MAVWYEYDVDVRACDAIFYDDGTIDWSEDGYEVLDHVSFDTEDEAIDYLLSITPEQLRNWEKQSGYNSIEAVVFENKVVGLDDHSEGNYDDFVPVASGEWIGDQLNGIWVGFDRIV